MVKTVDLIETQHLKSGGRVGRGHVVSRNIPVFSDSVSCRNVKGRIQQLVSETKKVQLAADRISQLTEMYLRLGIVLALVRSEQSINCRCQQDQLVPLYLDPCFNNTARHSCFTNYCAQTARSTQQNSFQMLVLKLVWQLSYFYMDNYCSYDCSVLT